MPIWHGAVIISFLSFNTFNCDFTTNFVLTNRVKISRMILVHISSFNCSWCQQYTEITKFSIFLNFRTPFERSFFCIHTQIVSNVYANEMKFLLRWYDLSYNNTSFLKKTKKQILMHVSLSTHQTSTCNLCVCVCIIFVVFVSAYSEQTRSKKNEKKEIAESAKHLWIAFGYYVTFYNAHGHTSSRHTNC